jgi:3-hydroxyisobutyrate dehydrogenase-like beta-hydroxyacid dehydrogenase
MRKHRIDPTRFMEIANGHVIRSPVYEGYGGMIVASRYEPPGFKLAHGLKDTRLALEAADEVNVPMPLASLVRDRYVSAVARGWSELDCAALGRVSAVDAGLGS